MPKAPFPSRKPIFDSKIQLSKKDNLPAPIVNFAGLTSTANPPDPTGDVGPNHFVQMVNATQFQVWDKQGNPLTGQMSFGNLWPAGDLCNANLGDPIVVYDHLADRWLLSQFADPHHMCIAISQTPDPTAGTWFLYRFDTGVFPDYPKFGVWPDGYYMSSYESPNLGVYAFDRANMILGNAANFVKTTIAALGAPGVRDTRILPSDLDGSAPPAGTSNYFVRTVDDQQDPANANDRIEVYEFTVDWSAQTFSFTLVATLTPTPFQMMLCNRNGGGVRDCIPQPTAATNTVDALSNRPMMQLNYHCRRGKGHHHKSQDDHPFHGGRHCAHETLVFNQTINVAGSITSPVPANEVAGIRWYELRRSGTNWRIHQEGTFAPQPAGLTAENQLLHRWMGSAAMDKFGNIALGYSITNGDANNPVFPGIRYAGRLASDPLGQLSQGEAVIFSGTNAQTQGLGARWGDYSQLSVDPTDGCTFWYTNHLAGTGGTGPRPSRIASFRLQRHGKDQIDDLYGEGCVDRD